MRCMNNAQLEVNFDNPLCKYFMRNENIYSTVSALSSLYSHIPSHNLIHRCLIYSIDYSNPFLYVALNMAKINGGKGISLRDEGRGNREN